MTVRSDVHYEFATAQNGKLVDILRPAAGGQKLPTALLWHGITPDERHLLRPLAEAVAALGLLVLVPDWRSDEPDGGRAHLLGSLEFARTRAAALGGDPERMVVAGWSAGAPAALGLALRPEVTGGWRPAAVVGIASRYDLPARTTGIAPLADLASQGPGLPLPVPVSLVHGTADPLMDVACSRQLRDALSVGRWPASLEEVDADHAGPVMAAYDPATDRCLPSTDPRVLAAGALTARAIARAAGVAV
ncbi:MULTISPECIES: alpha/beta hydrolase [Streptomyces]|uniref:Alpha/beta hydrolase n=1 Tax=Streptomyces luteosporeus TaxID=173856 RepID=A0ABP6G7W0_9ACTN